LSSPVKTETERIRSLRDRLWRGFQDMEEVHLNGDFERRIAGNLNVSFNFVEGESLIMAIKDLAVSSGSACTSASLEPSYVLKALGRNDELAQFHPFHHRPLHHRGRDRLHHQAPAREDRQAARHVAAVGDVQGWCRPRHGAMGCPLNIG
jgi:hypothetical protein